jgi:hypothetical protein
MKRYVNIEIYELDYPTKEEAAKHKISPFAQTETVRILSAEEEKEFAWEWFKKCFGKIEKKEEEELLREEFECLWKEQS